MSQYVDAEETSVLVFHTGLMACYRAICALGIHQQLDNPAIDAAEKLAIEEVLGRMNDGSHAPEAIASSVAELRKTLKQLRFEG